MADARGELLRGDVRTARRTIAAVLREDPGALYARGPRGGTIVHFAALVGQFELCKFLVGQMGPDIQDPERGLCQCYSAGAFTGENLLHIAIVKRANDFAEWLLQQPSGPKLLDGQATGSFFRFGNGVHPDSTDGKTLDGTMGALYCGEYPVLFAVATSQPGMLELCLKYSNLYSETGTHELFRVDEEKGNGALHIAALYNLPRMFDYLRDVAVDRKIFFANDDEGGGDSAYVFRKWFGRLNKDHCSALTLAATRGITDMVKHLLEQNKRIEWVYARQTPFAERSPCC